MKKHFIFLWYFLILAVSQANPLQQMHNFIGSIHYGNKNAPIKIRMYYALTCTHCKDWEEKYFPTIQTKYIQTGKVSFEMMDFPIDSLSVKLALLANCGGKQLHSTLVRELFDQQVKLLSSRDPLQTAKEIVMNHGISSSECDQCLLTKRMEDQIMENVKVTTDRYKISWTPAFLVNDQLIDGELTPDMIETMVSKASASAS